MNKLFGLLFTLLSSCVFAQPSSMQTIGTAWGNYIDTKIPGYSITQLQVSIIGQNSVWHGLFALQGTNAYTPTPAYNNVKLISWSGYNASQEDVQALIMSNSSTSGFDTTTLVLKTGNPAAGSATITVVAIGQNASYIALSSQGSIPYNNTMATSVGTYNTWTVNGNTGIGTMYPEKKLDVTAASADVLSLANSNLSGPGSRWNVSVYQNTLQIGRAGIANDFVIESNGNIGIGTYNMSDANYRLFVEKGIRTRKVKVDQTSPWPDYVFHSSYKLPSLQEVEKFINKHKHLPGVVSASEVEKEGLDVGDNQAAMLKKIEELTLYVIELNKKVASQERQIKRLKRK